MASCFNAMTLKQKILSCSSERSLLRGFDIYWAVLLYCEYYSKTINQCEVFLTQFSTKSLHWANDTLQRHVNCNCDYCKIQQKCQNVLIKRGHFAGPDEYYPTSLESIDLWTLETQEPLNYFKMYFDLKNSQTFAILILVL